MPEVAAAQTRHRSRLADWWAEGIKYQKLCRSLGGTEGSNPSPSSGESKTNPIESSSLPTSSRLPGFCWLGRCSVPGTHQLPPDGPIRELGRLFSEFSSRSAPIALATRAPPIVAPHIRADSGFSERIFVFHPKSSYFHLSQTCRRFAVRRNAHGKVFIGQHEARLVVVAGSRRLPPAGSGTGRFRVKRHRL